MKIERISYQKAFVIGPYLQEKIGLEVQIDEGEDPAAAFERAKELVARWHVTTNPQPDFSAQGAPPTELPVIDWAAERRISRLIDDMNACRVLTELQTYYTLAKANPDLEAAYEARKRVLVAKEAGELLDTTNKYYEEVNKLKK